MRRARDRPAPTGRCCRGRRWPLRRSLPRARGRLPRCDRTAAAPSRGGRGSPRVPSSRRAVGTGQPPHRPTAIAVSRWPVLSAVSMRTNPMTPRPQSSPSARNCRSASASRACGAFGIGAGDAFDCEQHLGERGARMVALGVEDDETLPCGLGAQRARVHQTAAGAFDDGDGLQRVGAGLLAASEGQQPLQDVPALEVTAEVPEQAERAGHLQRLVEVTVGAAEPGECGAHVRLILSQPGQGVALPEVLAGRAPRRPRGRGSGGRGGPRPTRPHRCRASRSAAYWRSVSSIR